MPHHQVVRATIGALALGCPALTKYTHTHTHTHTHTWDNYSNPRCANASQGLTRGVNDVCSISLIIGPLFLQVMFSETFFYGGIRSY